MRVAGRIQARTCGVGRSFAKVGMRDKSGLWTKNVTIMALAWGLLLVTFLLPNVRLDGGFSRWLVRLTLSAGVPGAVAISLVGIALLTYHSGVPWKLLLQRLATHVTVLAVLLGGGAAVNEWVIKPALSVPRPNIERLAEEQALGMTAEEFYASMDKQQRRGYLRQVLMDPAFHSIALDASVRDHWIHETGYSLPSGHAFTAMLLAGYFLGMGSGVVERWRRRVFYLLPVWAVAIGCSRVLLRVHRPSDVVWGGGIGISLAVVGVCLSRWLSRERRR